MSERDPLHAAADAAAHFLETLEERPVRAEGGLEVRISVSNRRTTDDDVDRSAEAVLAAGSVRV